MAFEGLTDKLNLALKKLRSKGKLSEQDVKDSMRDVRLALLEADVNYKVAKEFINTVTQKAIGQDILNSLTPAQGVIKVVNEELTELMGTVNTKIKMAAKPPSIVLMCGLQGGGKTTHSAKLAKFLKDQGKRPLLVACDIYRPAAIDQLKIIGQKAGVPVFEMGQIDPVKIAKEAIKHAKTYDYDLVIIDTAGRLHVDEELMTEIKNIKQAVTPNEIILVLDAMTGQDAVNVAKNFNDALEIDGVILTKLDGDTRGGAALSIRSVTGKPIKFIGVGEKVEDLEAFYPDRMASRILGMGDMLTLIEKAGQQIDEKENEKLAKKLRENKFDLNDLYVQMKQIKKMGSMRQILDMIPGVGAKIKDNDIDENAMGRVEAIILSMTKKEREKPSIIDPKRKRRIAAGSGTRVEDVNRLLKQFEQMQKMMKQFKGKKMRMPKNFM